MQGSKDPLWKRISVSLVLATSFVVSAMLIFTLASLLGVFVSAFVPKTVLLNTAAIVLILLAAVDLYSWARSSYCAIGFIRQTPQVLQRQLGPLATAFVWGFDTGLSVTTIRVTACTWAALALSLLGLSNPWAGLFYGLAFGIPVAILLWNPRLASASTSRDDSDPGLARQLDVRPTAQLVSVALLSAGALMILLAAGNGT